MLTRFIQNPDSSLSGLRLRVFCKELDVNCYCEFTSTYVRTWYGPSVDEVLNHFALILLSP